MMSVCGMHLDCGHYAWRPLADNRDERRVSGLRWMWSFNSVLKHELLTVVSGSDERQRFEVRIGTLRTPVTLVIETSPATGYVRCAQSHTLVTPLPHRTKRPGIELRNPRTFIPGFALSRVLDAMTKEYRAAVAAGHGPDESWLMAWHGCTGEGR